MFRLLSLAASILGLISVSAWAKPPTVIVTSATPSSAGMSLQWEASSPELQFTVESREALGAGGWAPLPNLAWPVRTNRIEGIPTEPGARFFRIAFEAAPGQRGRLVSATLLTTLNQGLIRLVFEQGGFPITADKDVQFLKLIYETVDAQGLPTLASGALALPVGVTTPLPLVSYQHGTIVVREDVPSRLNLEGVIGVAFATTGYAAVLPDYVGLGDSPGFHSYQHARSEATSVIDLLRAARTYAAENGVQFNGKLFLAGYSQGGHATLAALREIESQHADEFSVTACAAGGGAYDLSGTTLDLLLAGVAVPNPYNFSYLLSAYVDIYDFAASLADVLRSPWRSTIPPLFDGETESGLINAALPSIPRDILDPLFLADLTQDPNHPFRLALRDNDLLEWAPRAPLRLYHCSGDQDVAPANSSVAFNEFRDRGATQVELLDPSPGASHGNCAVPTLLDAKAWFDSLR